mmetsp:Transcript_1631/g.5041  ORF Transcript_1631/g.5041 Transcript_1631/m.5041 type:complete len:378 (+) Transcript_1631:380-1513(+)
MHIVFDLTGHVVVDHVLDVRKIEALGGDVGGDQHMLVTGLEVGDSLLAFILEHATVHSHRLDALGEQILVDVVHLALLLREDEHRGSRLLQHLQQIDDLGLLLDVLNLLDDVQVGGSGTAHVHLNGRDQRTLGELLDLARHGGREEKRLARARRTAVQQLVELVAEAHVQQTIGLVEHQHLNVLQRHAHLVAHQIEHTTGSAHHDGGSSPKGHRLLAQAQTTHRQQTVDRRRAVSAQLGEHAVDLRGQLTCRRQHQHSGGRHASICVQQTLQHREKEGGRLAAAGLRAAAHITPAQHRRHTACLHFCRRTPAQLYAGLHQCARQMQVGKGQLRAGLLHQLQILVVLLQEEGRLGTILFFATCLFALLLLLLATLLLL